MKICSNCKLEKPDDKFYTYWHSTQKKYRTRRICTDCTDEQKRQYRLKKKQEILLELSPQVISQKYKDNPEYKLCSVCNIYKERKTEFYSSKQTGYTNHLCKLCHNLKSRQRSREYFEQKRINNGGSEKVKTRPNQYMDEYQKEQTFWIMKLMGWTFDEETKIWWKDGIKDKNNNWNKIKPKQKAQKPPRKIIDVNKIIELKSRGFSNTEISNMLNYTQMTIRKYLRIYSIQNGKDKVGND